MVELPTLTLSVWRQGPEVLGHLSDGRGLQAFGTCEVTDDRVQLSDRLIGALRQASAGRVHLQTAAGPVTLPEHPAFWAGFALIGEPD